eukprot:gnl/TRDRNA2_/TRDRNA2_177531_c0_seq16.p1 gnl/TRDRNA2_/TRDRNA2_177531_c0~~gnl/TRDRNA2_/TRDRNA2_177531_c0_seq16.p1  ORF type:complete len:542 (+),score=59.00 gnl/TRDRNA2_/TRDRNA2_177531_c0_seq16:62-1687(+)
MASLNASFLVVLSLLLRRHVIEAACGGETDDAVCNMPGDVDPSLHAFNQSSSLLQRARAAHDQPTHALNVLLKHVKPVGVRFHNLIRPLFRKSLRCTGPGPSLSDCEECLGSEDCFGDCKYVFYDGRTTHDLCVHATATSKWTRFLVIIHMECPVKSIDLSQSVKEMSAGSMEYSWDGQSIAKMTAAEFSKIPKTDFPWPLWTTQHELEAGGAKGGHTLSIEFNRPPGQSAAANVFNLKVIMLNVYASCMDSKACLNTLQESGDAGLTLRNSNKLLRECLQAPFENAGSIKDVGAACASWRQCLKDAGEDRDAHMLLLLSAAALGTGEGSGAQKPSDKTCIHPPTEDPMAWDCDCFEQMHKTCDAAGATTPTSLEACIRAQFCQYEGVCEPWREEVCNGRDVQTWIQKLAPSQPSTENSKVSAKLVYEKTQCRSQARYLGKTLQTVAQCAEAAAKNPTCGNSIMYPDPKTRLWASWGCRCCKKGLSKGKSHVRWNVYEITKGAASTSRRTSRRMALVERAAVHQNGTGSTVDHSAGGKKCK